MSVVLAAPTSPTPDEQSDDVVFVIPTDPTFAQLRDLVVGADLVLNPDTVVVSVLDDGRTRIRGAIRSQYARTLTTTRQEIQS